MYAVIPVRGSENEESPVALRFRKKRLIDWTIDEAMKSKKYQTLLLLLLMKRF